MQSAARTCFILSLLAAGMVSLSACDKLSETDQTELTKSAENFIKEGNIRSAVIELKNVLQQNPEHAEARLLLGRAYSRLGDHAAALKELERAIKFGIATEDVKLSLWEAKLGVGMYQEVLDETDAVAEKETSAEILSLRGAAYEGLENKERARDLYADALKIDPNSYESLIGLAKMSFSYKDLAETEKKLNQAIEQDPNKLTAWQLLGSLELSRGDYPDAEKAFRQALSIAKQNPQTQIGLARALITQLKLDEAKAQLLDVERRFPGNLTTLYLGAFIASLEKDMKKAKNDLLRLLSQQANNTQALLLLGKINFEEGQYEQAKELLSHYVNIIPTYNPANVMLAATLLKLNDGENAIKLLLPIVEKNSDDAQLVTLLGSAYIKAGRLDEGTETLKRAVKLDPDAAYIQTQLAIGHLANGVTDDAIAALESAVSVDRNLYQADFVLIITRINHRDYQGALDDAKKLADNMKDNPIPLNLMGTAYIGMGELERARVTFEKSLEIDPNYTTAILNLAYLDLQNDDIASAKKHYEKALKINDTDSNALMGMLTVLKEEGKDDEIIKMLLNAYKKEPENASLSLLLARYYLDINNPRQALIEVEKTLKLEPDNSAAIFLRISALRLSGKHSEALDILKDLARKQPESVSIAEQSASIQLQLNKPNDARNTLKEVLRFKPDNLSLLTSLLKLEAQLQNYDEAIKIAQQLQKRYPRIPNGYTLEGNIHTASNNPAKAVAVYTKALQIGQNNQHLLNLYRSQTFSNDKKSARNTLESWLSGHPDDLVIQMALAQDYENAGEVDKAIQKYESILSGNKGNLIAVNNLALLYLQKGDSKASELAKTLAAAVPEDGLSIGEVSLLDTAGWVYIHQDQVKTGYEMLNKAMQFAPTIPDIKYHVAEAMAKMGEKDNATNTLKQLLTEHKTFGTRKAAENLLSKLESGG